MVQSGVVHKLLVAIAAVSLAIGGRAAPSVTKVQQSGPQLNGQSFDLTVDLAWPLESNQLGFPAAGGNVFCRVVDEADNKVLAVSTFPAYDKSGNLHASGSCREIRLHGYGTHHLRLDLSLSDSFAFATYKEASVRSIPGWLTVLPPILAMGLVIFTKDVLLSLFCGTWLAGFFIYSYNPFVGLLHIADVFILDAFVDRDHAFTILFLWFMSGLLAAVQRAGGAQGLSSLIQCYGTSRRMTMLLVFASGILIFFDDYATSLIVGGAFRPVTDAMLISREKLALLVDTTAAPVASLSPISSWIGIELSLIRATFDEVAAAGISMDVLSSSPIVAFLRTLPGHFYPIAILCLQLMLVLLQRDFGPMRAAEQRAIKKRQLFGPDANTSQTDPVEAFEPKPGAPACWWNSVVPVSLVVVFLLLGLSITGADESIKADLQASAHNVFGEALASESLLWATLFVSIITFAFFRLQVYSEDNYGKGSVQWAIVPKNGYRPLMHIRESLMTWVEGIKQLMFMTIVLILAWAFSLAMKRLGTGDFLAAAISDSVDPRGIPALSFLMAAILASVMGTPWVTMVFIFPVATRAVIRAAPGEEKLLLNTISAILSGAVFGDHMSPISDTTILSSIACRCDLMHHVRTQAPYAAYVAAISIIFGDLLSGYAYPAWVGLIITLVIVLSTGFVLASYDFSSRAALKESASRAFKFGPVNVEGDEDLDVEARAEAKASELEAINKAMGAESGYRPRLAMDGTEDDEQDEGQTSQAGSTGGPSARPAGSPASDGVAADVPRHFPDQFGDTLGDTVGGELEQVAVAAATDGPGSHPVH